MAYSSMIHRKLRPEFVNYIESAKTLCIYKFGDLSLSPNVYFPRAKTLTVLNCNKAGIRNILKPEIFPNVTQIHYLSQHPGDTDIYKKFNESVEWIFPNKHYNFYDYMVKIGYGKKDPFLISKYLVNKEIVDSESPFDVAFKFDINIPDYGITNGEWYRTQFYEYLGMKSKQYDKISNYTIQEMEELHLQREFVKNIIDIDVMETEMK